MCREGVQVPCMDCNKTYIGEIKRTLRVRLGEHKQAARRGDLNKLLMKPSMRLTGTVPELRELHLITGREESWKPYGLRSVFG